MTPIGNRPVVFGVDSAQQDAALAWAVDEAARRRAPLHLVHAVLPVTHHVHGVVETAHHKELRQLGDELLDKAVVRARERRPGLDVATFITESNPAQSLVSQSRHADLVVLGSRRLGRLAEMLSAYSTTVPVSANAACPVAVVPETEYTVEEPPYLVVGVDGSAAAEVALEHALTAAAARGAAVRAVWAWPRPLLGFLDERAAVEDFRGQLDAATAPLAAAHPDVPLSRELRRGHPVDVLADAGRQALAVVVGRRGRGGFTGMRLGSVPHGLLHRAGCPVITVPTSADATAGDGDS
ncbi:universal stress protein [Streptomyces cavernicola]|uniref:Universal stress protein n=1 Tax=Streptomyces cavernicola TaxID=3043613 RepID=A0ABT6SHX5_9ACTN|nr:universal stress protein [Streptomyces sp. B-S-A6]MDI3406856.1 universal stress protein [Streptomyces sp. B-S-A6]